MFLSVSLCSHARSMRLFLFHLPSPRRVLQEASAVCVWGGVDQHLLGCFHGLPPAKHLSMCFSLGTMLFLDQDQSAVEG